MNVASVSFNQDHNFFTAAVATTSSPNTFFKSPNLNNSNKNTFGSPPLSSLVHTHGATLADVPTVTRNAVLGVFSYSASRPPRCKALYEWPAEGNVVSICMMHRSNLLAVRLESERLKVFIYDDARAAIVTQISVEEPVCAALLRRNAIIILTTRVIAVYSLSNPPRVLGEIMLSGNGAGTLLAATTSIETLFVIAESRQQQGHIVAYNLSHVLPHTRHTNSSSNLFENPSQKYFPNDQLEQIQRNAQTQDERNDEESDREVDQTPPENGNDGNGGINFADYEDFSHAIIPNVYTRPGQRQSPHSGSERSWGRKDDFQASENTTLSSILLPFTGADLAGFSVIESVRGRSMLESGGSTKTAAEAAALEPRAAVIFRAHDGPLRALAVTNDGSRIASASKRGTLVRVWETRTRSLLHEFRRGTEPAIIHSLVFDCHGARLLVSSDKATVHLFNCRPSPQKSAQPSVVSSSFPQQQLYPYQKPSSSNAAEFASGSVSLARAPSAHPLKSSAKPQALSDEKDARPGSLGVCLSGSCEETDGASCKKTKILPMSPAASIASPSQVSPASSTDSVDHQRVRQGSGSSGRSNKRSSLAFSILRPMLPAYFNSEWSFAMFRIPPEHCSGINGTTSESQMVAPKRLIEGACFVSNSQETILVVLGNGRVFRFKYDTCSGGEGSVIGYWLLDWRPCARAIEHPNHLV